jgi:aspartate kinase
MEEILASYLEKRDNLQQLFETLKTKHLDIARELDKNNDEISVALEKIFSQLSSLFLQEPSPNYDYEYDKIVSYGELLSTKLITIYLNQIGIQSVWVDARKIVKTDNNFREGKVNWDLSEQFIREKIQKTLSNKEIRFVITQGFIAGTEENITTTLGREGSDYSAAIIAYAMDAKSVTIWKDVAGLYNADPKFFAEAVKIDTISYEEAIELSYYGATIIHPKTIKPLQNKNIPLFVKSFYNPSESGTIISAEQPKETVPCYIFKRNQILITLFPKDFSFIAVQNLNEIFSILSKYKLKINIMQNSALSFSICVDNIPQRVALAIEELTDKYKIKYNENVELITVRHYTDDIVDKVVRNRKIYVEQKDRTTTQVVVRV